MMSETRIMMLDMCVNLFMQNKSIYIRKFLRIIQNNSINQPSNINKFKPHIFYLIN